MDKRTIHHIAILILAVAGLSTAAVVALVITRGGSVLEGESHHDFDVVLIDTPSSTFQHTFHLTNTSDEVVVIKSAKPSCSCVTSQLSTFSLDPGQTVDIATRMRLRESGHRKVSITLALDNDQTHGLTVEASGRLRQQLTSTATFVWLAPESPALLMVWLEAWEDIENAPQPTLITPEGVTGKFTRWDLNRRGNDAQGRPAHWSGRIEVEQHADALPEDAVLTVQYEGNEPVIVHLAPPPPAHAPTGNPAERPSSDG